MKEEGLAVGLNKELHVEFMKLDLGSLESTKTFTENFKQKNLPLHILICNAGIGLAQQGTRVYCLSVGFQGGASTIAPDHSHLFMHNMLQQ